MIIRSNQLFQVTWSVEKIQDRTQKHSLKHKRTTNNHNSYSYKNVKLFRAFYFITYAKNMTVYTKYATNYLRLLVQLPKP